MNKQMELDKLDRTIKDGTIRACTVKSNIEILDRQIDSLGEAERQLEENLKFLKQEKGIAVSVDEFKKIKEELAKTRIRLITSKNEREDFRKALNNVNKAIEDSKEAIEKIKKDGENNVLRLNFGKKENG